MNSRIRTPFYMFFLNLDYVAARSLRSLRSNYVAACSLRSLRRSNYNFLEIVIGLKETYFPLIRLPSCFQTVCYWIVCYWTVCYRTA